MHSAKEQYESKKSRIASKRVNLARRLLMVGFLLVMTVLSTSADMGQTLFTRSGIVSPEPTLLAIFGSALISIGLLFRHQPSDSNSAE
jgi:membrane glycosyltransferase